VPDQDRAAEGISTDFPEFHRACHLNVMIEPQRLLKTYGLPCLEHFWRYTMLIVIATTRAKEIQDFIAPLEQLNDVEIAIVQTGAVALEKVKSESPAFVIADQGLPDFEPLALITEIVKINAMINTAVVSSMNHKDFHEASEGLGVLAPIPTQPKSEDGIQLAELFSRFM